jgi:hypothetical protein
MVAAVLPLMLLAAVPPAKVLAFVATMAMAGAALAALIAWRAAAPPDPERVGLWDVSGALGLVGTAAVAFADDERLIALIVPMSR